MDMPNCRRYLSIIVLIFCAASALATPQKLPGAELAEACAIAAAKQEGKRTNPDKNNILAACKKETDAILARLPPSTHSAVNHHIQDAVEVMLARERQ